MSSSLTPRQWVNIILVNVVISAVTTLLIVRVLTNQPGVRPAAAAVPAEPTVAAVAAQALVPSPSASPSLTPLAVAAVKPTSTSSPVPPTLTPVPAAPASPTSTPRSTGSVGISTVLYAGQKQREVVVFVNQGNEVSLKGWTLTSTRNISYTFGNVTLFKDSFISLHTTTGSDVPTDLFMNRSDAAWQVGDVLTLSAQGNPVATVTVRQQ
ncbi:MAG TPA: lamin tail domain-containing protein [Anaerolineae bacterium]